MILFFKIKYVIYIINMDIYGKYLKGENMKKSVKLLLILFIVLIAILCVQTNSEASSKTLEEVKIYAIDQYDSLKYKINIPSNFITSYNITVPEKYNEIDYKVIKGSEIISIDNNGKIIPKAHLTMYLGGGIFDAYEYGTATIRITTNNNTYEQKITLLDYKNTYANEVLDNFLKTNIKSTMTEYEKLKTICEYIANNYSYSGNISTYQGLVITGGGDCWANSQAIIYMCNKIGINAKLRYAANDTGAGSGHRNVTVYVDGEYYIADAGYTGTAPRYYSLEKEQGGFFYSVNQDGTLTIRQYDGFETNVIVPSELFGKKVTKIGSKAFYVSYLYSETQIDTVTLPNTIEEIEEGAFSGIETLKSVNIPNSVKTMVAPFYDTPNLKINISSSHPYFILENDIIYNKNKTELIECLSKEEKDIIIPDTVKKICIKAFTRSKVKTLKLSKNLETVSNQAFYNCVGLRGIEIPASVKTIEYQAFGAPQLNSVIIQDGCTAEVVESAFYDLEYIRIPSTITKIDKKAFEYHNDLVICGKLNSYAQSYATENNIKFEVEDSKKEITPGMIVIENTNFQYNGKKQVPKETIYFGSVILKEGTDYICTYSTDSINVGEYELKITGIGKYKGTQNISYSIRKAENEFDFICEDITYGEKVNPIVTKNLSSEKPIFMYKTSQDATWATSTMPKDVGTYWIIGQVSPFDNYYYKQVEKAFKILPAKNDLKINCPDVQYGQEVSPTITRNTSGGKVTYYYKIKGSSDSTYTKTIPTKVGTYTLKAVSEATKNYKKTEVILDFKITEIPVTNITLNKTNLILENGKTYTLTYKITPSNATQTKATWKTSNSAICTIDNGIVTAKSEGTAKITVTIGGKSQICNITVVENLGYVLGDINKDKKIDIKDVKLALQYSLGKIELDSNQVLAGDVNKSKNIDIKDVKKILQYSLKKITKF